MPNKRAADQTLIAFALKGELLRGVDIARARRGQNRSEFIREAVRAELQRLGVEVAESAARAPDRAKAKRYGDRPSPAAAPQSNFAGVPGEALAGVAAAEAEYERERVRRAQTSGADGPSGSTGELRRGVLQGTKGRRPGLRGGVQK